MERGIKKQYEDNLTTDVLFNFMCTEHTLCLTAQEANHIQYFTSF